MNTIRAKCQNPQCGIRFPLMNPSGVEIHCPACRTSQVKVDDTQVPGLPDSAPNPAFMSNVEVLLDNIRSAENTGSILRTCDALGIRRVHRCGLTPPFQGSKVAKTALGTQKFIEEVYWPDSLDACVYLKREGYQILILELWQGAETISSAQVENGQKILLVLGSENAEVDPALRPLARQVLYLPMAGTKNSLNVAAAFAAAGYLLNWIYRQKTVSDVNQA